MSTTQTTSSSEPRTNYNSQDKLRDGPCSEVFLQLEMCAQSKGVDMKNHKLKLMTCPSDTDRLIKCMNKNPKFFYQ